MSIDVRRDFFLELIVRLSVALVSPTMRSASHRNIIFCATLNTFRNEISKVTEILLSLSFQIQTL